MRKITYYENILEFKENAKEQLNLNEVNNWKLCRTCLLDTNDDDVDLETMSIIDVMQGRILSIKDMLIQTTNIKMNESKNLPLKICKDCFNKITTCYYFAIQVCSAEKVLMRLANKLKDKQTDQQESCVSVEEEGEDESVLMEVEELFDVENAVDISNYPKEENKTHKEDLKEDSEKFPSQSKEILEYNFGDNFSQIKAALLTEGEIEIDLKSTYSEEVIQLENYCVEATEASDGDELGPVREMKMTKKRISNVNLPTTGYRHKQPRVTSPLLNEIVCAICNNAFERQHDLVSHVKSVHPNSKAFKCRVCGNLFSHIQSLSRHMNSHKESVFLNECEYCTKPFVRVDDLKRHLRIHTGERHVCSLCDKSFQQLNDLKLHEEKHQQEKDNISKIYECQQCEQTYTSRNGLYLHKKKHHTQSDRMAGSLCGSHLNKIVEDLVEKESRQEDDDKKENE